MRNPLRGHLGRSRRRASRRAVPVTVHGTYSPGFAPLAQLLHDIVEQYGGGGAVCVYHRGVPVVDVWAGMADRGIRWERDTMAPSFSTTKGVAATALHIMVDRGLLDYDDRVCRYWPEFAQAGKGDITVRQVLAHQSGLYHIRQMIDHADDMLDWERVIHALERATPVHPPGERTGYHGLTFGYLVGEIIQRVSGKSFSEVVRKEIAEPLGLDGCYIGAPGDALPRAAKLLRAPSVTRALTAPILRDRVLMQSLATFAQLAQRLLNMGGVPVDVESLLDALAPRGIAGFDFSAPETLRATIPAANGLFTARSLARMYAALAAGGELDGVRLLSPNTLFRATERQEPTRHHLVIPFDMGWRLGYHSVLTTRGFLPEAFGHFGLGGSGAFACPIRQLSVALIVNSGLGSPFGDLRIIRTGGTATACARRSVDAA